MAASTTKKVVVHRFDRQRVAGYVHPQTYLRSGGLELLTPDGNFAIIPYGETKAVYFVQDFDDAGGPPARKTFLTRPKVDGLWVRMTFRDGEVMDGLLPNNLLQMEPQGFTVTPPDTNTVQRVFVPRAALQQFTVLAVIGSGLRAGGRKRPVEEQIRLFEEPT